MARGQRYGRRWQALRRTVFATTDVCWLCSQPVDMTLPYKNPDTGQVNRWSKSLDHVTPLNKGGSLLDLNNARLAHLTCNSSRKDGPPNRINKPSRDW